MVEVDYIPQLDEWQIFVGTPLYDTKGPAEANSRVIKALQSLGIYRDIPIRRVFVKSPNDPTIKALEAEVKGSTEGAIHVVAIGPGHDGPYSVIFAPFTGPGGAVPARRFDTLDQLSRFLEDEIGVSRSAVEDAVSEIRQKGAASVFHVQLTRREVRRLRLG
ncbi:MAG TPA: hypothetical protein VGS05_18385 [Candidatus Sulfotelmatobacter sp.]|nr:hypothetical protein [Candidatus Sulfotelmatobacter sp.]